MITVIPKVITSGSIPISQNLAMNLALPDSPAEASSLVVSRAIRANTQTTPRATPKPTTAILVTVDIVELVTVETTILSPYYQYAGKLDQNH
jgi:hypothetical protein